MSIMVVEEGKVKKKNISSEINQLKYVVNTIYLILYTIYEVENLSFLSTFPGKHKEAVVIGYPLSLAFR